MTYFSNMKVLGYSLVILTLAVSCGNQPTGNSENGKRWFNMNNCTFCHGDNAQGKKGPKIAGLKLSYSAFENKIRKPKSAIMPKFSEEEVSKQDAADIYAWLKSLK